MPDPQTIARRSRIAYLSYSTAEFDSRTRRMAASARAAGYEAIVYARWEPGLPLETDISGVRLVRVPTDLLLAIPGLRRLGRRRLARRLGSAAAAAAATRPAAGSLVEAQPGAPSTSRPSIIPDRLRGTPVGTFLRGVKEVIRAPRRWWRRFGMFPLRPIAWAVALEERAEPADIWHGMWAGSLPALARLRDRHGGRTIYDSRDIYLNARAFDRMSRAWRSLYSGIEGRWARAADAVLTVNDAYAGILEESLRVPRPAVVMNCPPRWQPPVPHPDLIRERLGLSAATCIVLYQGNLMTERGIEQSMEAILDVPGAVLVLLGYGGSRDQLAREAATPTYRGRVFVVGAVPPDELLAWTASADVLVMAIQPTTLNHRFTTPQKLFEAMAAGIPVVASDLPGMADIVTATGTGVLCDPTSPAAIAAALRSVLEAPPAEREAARARALRAAHDRYNWEAQATTLFDLYGRLQAGPSLAGNGGRSPA
jgi:glycosyltransferase involved in cell wall biosynthesis